MVHEYQSGISVIRKRKTGFHKYYYYNYQDYCNSNNQPVMKAFNCYRQSPSEQKKLLKETVFFSSNLTCGEDDRGFRV